MSQLTGKVNFFWFRRDLRLDDNAGLYHALRQGKPVIPVFIFDTEILDLLPSRRDARVVFIHQSLRALQEKLSALGSALLVMHGKPMDVWRNLAADYSIEAVFTNHDYEPQAIRRDQAVSEMLREKNIAFHSFKDQCFFEKNEVLKDDGTPYTVFTAYKNKWYKKLYEKQSFYLKAYPVEKYLASFAKLAPQNFPSLSSIGFEEMEPDFPGTSLEKGMMLRYAAERDIPSVRGTSRLGLHLRFGTVSIRALFRQALPVSEMFTNELIWRDFYMMILWHFPHVVGGAFKKEYDNIHWQNNEQHFERWRAGKTGFPLVDAGMRELAQTGYMHNRVRMVTASFLCKHLLIDWRWGEAWFAEKLLDFELASNNGGWQWSAGTGCDAAPYFRIFNPTEQLKKFDPQLHYVRKWVPEFDSLNYPQPIVDHKMARQRCLETYKQALGN